MAGPRVLITPRAFLDLDGEHKNILKQAGYELDKDMDTALWEGKYHMFERIPQDLAIRSFGNGSARSMR